MAALDAALELSADRSIARDLRRRIPDLADSDDELLALVGRARSAAASYGLLTDREVASFVQLGLTHGESFHEQPEFARFLQARRVSPGGRLASLLRWLGEAR